MSSRKKAMILIILNTVGFGLLLAIMILGAIFPGDPAPEQIPWFVWTAIGETVVFIIATVVMCIVVRKKDKKTYE